MEGSKMLGRDWPALACTGVRAVEVAVEGLEAEGLRAGLVLYGGEGIWVKLWGEGLPSAEKGDDASYKVTYCCSLQGTALLDLSILPVSRVSLSG